MCDIYQQGMNAEAFADEVLKAYFKNEIPSFPIDPFKMMRDFGVVYQFMNLKKLEGIYLIPENNNDIAVAGINYNRRITRRRFTAAHELCHHLKDKTSEVCDIGNRQQSTIETYAEGFAAALLMPLSALEREAEQYKNDGKVDLNAAFYLSIQFGVSFRACANRLAYSLHLLTFTSNTDLDRRISLFKPDKKKKELGIDVEDINLVRQSIDSYEFFFCKENNLGWYQFKNDFIYNENRMEGVKLDDDFVAEIVTDLRLNKQDSEYCNTDYDDIIQIVGHSTIYEFIFETKKIPNIFNLLNLHGMLFKYSPHPEESGKIRCSNNVVFNSRVETVDFHDVPVELAKLDKQWKTILEHLDSYTVSEYLEEIVKIHHRITQIHPFNDGNGRCSRSLLNWQLRLKKLPPIYIKSSDKKKYYDGLALADEKQEYKELLRVLIHELFRSIIALNKEIKL